MIRRDKQLLGVTEEMVQFFASKSTARLLWQLLCLLIIVATEATKIKWTSASSGNQDPAKTAPKSQKYWDEHNIERPDYGKTDAEIAAERGESYSVPPVAIVLVLGVAYAIYQHNNKNTSGTRLGSAESNGLAFSQGDAEERARLARLARFEENRVDTKID